MPKTHLPVYPRRVVRRGSGGCILLIISHAGIAGEIHHGLNTPALLSEWPGWLPLCLTHRSYSCLFRFDAHYLRDQMQASKKTDRRRQERIQAVLPVRVRGRDSSGASFEALAHTLDLTPIGARLGAIRQELKTLDTLTIFYHQRRMEFTVVWTRLLDGKDEYQVGLQAFAQEKEPWGMSFLNSSSPATRAGAMHGAA